MSILKKILSILVCIAIIGLGIVPVENHNVQASTERGSCGENVTWQYDTETKVLIFSGTGEMDTAPLMDFSQDVKNVIVESGITNIKGFSYPNMSYCSIPNTIVNIENFAFSECESLENISLPNSVITIGEAAFSRSGLKKISIPASVKSIGRSSATIGNPFSYCKNLAEIKVDSDNPYYDSRNDCNAIIDKTYNALISGCYNTVIPESVLEISSNAFDGCEKLTSIFIPKRVKNVGYSFANCKNLTEIKVDENNPYLDSRNNCNGIIKTGTDEFCTGCKNSIIPYGVKSIKASAFSRCDGLNRISIPSTVLEIENNAFFNCPSLTSVTISEGLTKIGQNAFSYCTNLSEINIPESVNEIGAYAFRECENLKTINIPLGVNIIEGSTFLGCKKLESVIVPESVTTISGKAFEGCTAMTSIVIPDNVTSIATSAFNGDTKLTIVAHKGSYAESFALSNGIAFQDIDAETTTVAPTTTSVKPTTTPIITTEPLVTTSKKEETTKGEIATTSKPIIIGNPRPTSIKKIKAKKKSLKIKWKKVSGVHGYKIQYSRKKNFKKAKTITVKSYSKTSKTIKKLKKKKKYYVRIRTFKIVGGKIYQSIWSKVKSKKTK